MDDVLANFVGITGASEDAAHQVLEMCAGDLGQAIQLWFSDEELQRNLSNPASASAAGAAPSGSSRSPPAVPHATRPTVGREDASGVIHIDSDDDGDDQDVPVLGGSSSSAMDIDASAESAAAVAQTAQEEEDAAMAKRLQEELYQGQDVDEEGIRAPMARTTETLVAPSGDWGVGEDMDDVNAAIQEQLRRRHQGPLGRSRNPFAQSIWEDPSTIQPPAPGPVGGPASGSGQSSRAQRLAELFRPPYELMSHFPWDHARDEGKQEKKWILVNLQDVTNFNCQALNRDIWKDDAIQQLVKENFIFLQYSKDDPRAAQYITFYLPNRTHENQDNYPHVSIVDPRTGEQVKVWTGLPFPTALDFHAELAEFLDRYSLEAHSKNPVVKAKRPERPVDVDRMTEEEMLQMAMQNSLESSGGSGSGSSSKPSVYDPDALTKSVGDLSGDKGKGRAEPESPAPVPGESSTTQQQQQQSAFSRIPSDRPHAEPETNDPATTTRIQFRHPTGRVIRRFGLDDTVSRVYEWLKAAPLEGREGVEFELKVMPQGRDLIQDLDKTIAEAGLKQGTVMIEFIEE